VTVIMVRLIKYILDEHVNITGAILTFLETTLQRIFVLLLVGLIIWEFVKSQIKKNIEEDKPQQESQGEERGGGGGRRLPQ